MWRRDGIIREKREEVVFPGTWTKVEIGKNVRTRMARNLSGWNLNNRQLRD